MGEGRKKLIVPDDLKSIIEREKSFLSRSAMTIFPAVFTDDILKIHAAEKADLIVVDHVMPGMCVDEMCSKIRMSPDLRKVSIIILCSGGKSAIERCKASGANSFFVKPLQYPEFLKCVREYLSISERQSMRVLMRVSVKSRHDNKYFFSTSQDISATGVMIETEKLLAKGDRITCSFFLKTSQVAVDGEVVRVRKKDDGLSQYGIKFIGIMPDTVMKIEEFIRQRHRR
ncbi:MAG: hypothetical protein OHK006_05620 [Thermodesulfovibrionales bacterium]